ncbi:MAG: ATP-binding cassette domain-containing protein, partial [Nitrospinaceae bacterium]
YGDLQHEFEALGGYHREAQAKTILAGLGFSPEKMERPLGEFSGGWRMRAELARLLLQRPEILLLDEPTNHLDLASVVWLEAFLRDYDGSLLLISHDRSFLNGLVTRIIELERGRLAEYTGDYTAYERQKAEREAQLESQAANQNRRIAELERFIERFRAKNTKATQAKSKQKILDRMQRVQTLSRTKTVHFRFPQPARTGRVVLEFTRVTKRYGDLCVYRDFSIQLERGLKIALVGPNGAGKSTLLKLMAGVLEFEGGEIQPGHNVTRAYFAQHNMEILDPRHGVLESLEQVAGDLPLTAKRSILGAFLFSGDDVEKKVSVLSGGEKARLALARLLARPAPLFLLDEPTNHLDIRSAEVLAAALADFDGTLVAISHDRYFLDGIVNRVWEVEHGRVREYHGNYSDYVRARQLEEEAAAQESSSGPADIPSKAAQDKGKKRQEAMERNARFRKLKPLETRLAKIEAELETLLQEKAEIETRLADPGLYQDKEKKDLMATLDRQRELSREEEKLMSGWNEVTAEIESFIGGASKNSP